MKETTTEETRITVEQKSILDQILSEQATVAARYMPVMSPKQAKQRMIAIQELKELCLVDGEDFGVIPGTGSKPTLFKPGAEKICAYFGYVPKYEILPGSIEEWTPEKYGEALFYYKVDCHLVKDGKPVGSGIGSCSSWERKYRYRASKRKCPQCQADALIKGKKEYEKGEYKERGSFLCFEKKGGCGSKFFGDDPEILNQPLGEVPNPDFADIINTVQKIACKRAYIASALSATGASQWFVPDFEDMPADTIEQVTRRDEPPNERDVRFTEDAEPVLLDPNAKIDKKMAKDLFAIGKSRGWTDAGIKEVLNDFGYQSSADIKVTDFKAIGERLSKNASESRPTATTV